MSFQSGVNITLGFGVPGELLVDGPMRADSLIVNSNGVTSNVIGYAFTKSASTNIAVAGGVIGTGASSFTASISGTTMTVTAVASGSIQVGQNLAGITTPCAVTAYLTGAGGTGTYTVATSQTFTTSGTLTPTLAVADNSQSSFLTMGTIVIASATAAAIGDVVVYNVITGQLSAVRPGAAYGNTNALVPNTVIYQYPTTAAGLVAARLTN
jgi:hypothetical protein